MTSADASFLYFERPEAPLHIGSTSILDGYLSRDALIEHLRRRIHRIPRYRQLAAFDPFNVAHPAWEDDPNFSVERHVEEVSLPAGAGDDELRACIAKLSEPMLPRDRPLWKMILIQGLPDGRTAATSLVHHCMVDGVSGIELLNAVTDLSRDAGPVEPEPFELSAAREPMTRVRDAWGDAFEAAAKVAVDNFRRMLDPQRQADEFRTLSRAMTAAAPQMMQPAPATPFNRPVGPRRSHTYFPMAFSELRQVRSVLGGTINDVVLTTLSGALGKYLRAHGQRTDGVVLRAMVPVNVRNEADKEALGNQVSMLLAPLPVGITDPAERHRVVCREMNGLKEANQAGGFAMMTRQSDGIPPAVQAFSALFMPPVQPLFNIVCTNVPGPQVPLYLAGRKMETLLPIVPLSMGLGMGCALTSYNGVLFWGIAADPALVPDVENVGAAVAESFDELKKEALIQSAVAAGPAATMAQAAPQREAIASR
jgi:WS/DGAT/MGAT family acyltransferase